MEALIWEKWDDLLNDLIDFNVVDTEEFKHLIFDTYCFFKENLAEGKEVPRDMLSVYKLIAQTKLFLSLNHMEGIPHRVSASFEDCTFGLCCVFERGFNIGYYKHGLPLGASIHIPAGCAAPEADMTSYESFSKSFEDNVEFVADCYDNLDEDNE